jgi:DNA-binding protein YbaB
VCSSDLDTIFSENYNFDKSKFKEEMKKMKQEMKKASNEWKKYAVNLQLENSITKLKNDPSWSKNFNVQFNENTCRVNLPNVVREIELPDIEIMKDQIEKAADIVSHVNVDINIPDISYNISNGPNGKNVFDFKINIPGYPNKSKDVRVDLDSIAKEYKYYNNQKFDGKKGRHINIDSLLTSIRSMVPDSSFFQGEFKGQMKEMQKEMKKFQQQMKQLEKELKKNNKEQQAKKPPIEI